LLELNVVVGTETLAAYWPTIATAETVLLAVFLGSQEVRFNARLLFDDSAAATESSTASSEERVSAASRETTFRFFHLVNLVNERRLLTYQRLR